MHTGREFMASHAYNRRHCIKLVMEMKHNKRIKEINEKVNKTLDFMWFDQLCLRPRSCRDFTNFGEKLRVTMFGGYLAFYTKESKALNINMKTDY